jgi:hypothetical protein
MKIFKIRRISPKRQIVESYDYFYKPPLRRNETQEFDGNTLKLRAREYKRYLEVRQRHIREREKRYPQNLMEE